jgi:hypothetical protein
MQIEIDFEVFKALTAKRESEADSYNNVIRRLLQLPIANTSPPKELPQNALLRRMVGVPVEQGRPTVLNALLGAGALFGNTFFPEGSLFRANYKGRTYYAQIKDGVWLGQDGVKRSSPSEAAGAISGTNVNGWRFWHVQRPGDADWVRMDELKSA